MLSSHLRLGLPNGVCNISGTNFSFSADHLEAIHAAKQLVQCSRQSVFPTIQRLPLYNRHCYHISQSASSHDTVNICGNKMPTRCNRGLYCRSYCLLNMFRASLYPSSEAQEYYTVVAACGILCYGFSSCWSGVEVRAMCPVCRMLQHPANRTHNPNDLYIRRTPQLISRCCILYIYSTNMCTAT